MCESRREEWHWKVAVASSDGENVDVHLGQSRELLIYELDGAGHHRLVERRRVAGGGRLDPHSRAAVSQTFAGVDVALAAQVGPGAAGVLRDLGVVALATSGPIARALTAYSRRGRILEGLGP